MHRLTILTAALLAALSAIALGRPEPVPSSPEVYTRLSASQNGTGYGDIYGEGSAGTVNQGELRGETNSTQGRGNYEGSVVGRGTYGQRTSLSQRGTSSDGGYSRTDGENGATQFRSYGSANATSSSRGREGRATGQSVGSSNSPGGNVSLVGTTYSDKAGYSRAESTGDVSSRRDSSLTAEGYSRAHGDSGPNGVTRQNSRSRVNGEVAGETDTSSVSGTDGDSSSETYGTGRGGTQSSSGDRYASSDGYGPDGEAYSFGRTASKANNGRSTTTGGNTRVRGPSSAYTDHTGSSNEHDDSERADGELFAGSDHYGSTEARGSSVSVREHGVPSDRAATYQSGRTHHRGAVSGYGHGESRVGEAYTSGGIQTIADGGFARGSSNSDAEEGGSI